MTGGRRPVLFLLALVLVLVGTGCDALTPGGPSFSGVVVDRETGEPVEGIHTSLKISGGGFGAYTTVAWTLTDGDGRFRLRDPKDRGSRPGLWVNSPDCYGASECSSNSAYIGGFADYEYDDRHDIRIELGRL